MSKDIIYRRLINTSRWRRLRAAVLSEHPLCERCEAEGYVTAATEVHHRTPVESAPSRIGKEHLMYSRANLMALCRRCHVAEHTAMGRSGRKLHQERVAAQVSSFASKFFGDPGG